MKWMLVVLYLQSQTAWNPPLVRVEYKFPDQASCETALASGSFELSTTKSGDQANALTAFCAPTQ